MSEKNHVLVLMHFIDKMAHLFFLEIEELRSESISEDKLAEIAHYLTKYKSL